MEGERGQGERGRKNGGREGGWGGMERGQEERGMEGGNGGGEWREGEDRGREDRGECGMEASVNTQKNNLLYSTLQHGLQRRESVIYLVSNRNHTMFHIS